MTDRPKLRLEYLDPADLESNPQNWRTHAPAQAEGLADVMNRVGWAGALLFNEATGRLIDGHLRKEIAEGPVPVLIGSWTEQEEALILATLDPIAAMAGSDDAKLSELLQSVGETDSEAINAILNALTPVPIEEPTAPADFPEADESIETEHKCPKCGYVWSGKAK